MPLPIGIIAALPWKKIAYAAAGAIVVAVLAYPWIALSAAKKDRDKAIAEKADTVRQLEASRASEARAIANREAIQAVADELAGSLEGLATATATAEALLATAARSARNIAAARGELEAIARSHRALEAQAEDLTVCETYELALRELAEASQ